MGQKPAETACRASDYTIRIMLSVSVGAVRRSYLRISRARRRRTGSPPQGPPGTRSVGGAAHFALLRRTGVKDSGPAPAVVSSCWRT